MDWVVEIQTSSYYVMVDDSFATVFKAASKEEMAEINWRL